MSSYQSQYADIIRRLINSPKKIGDSRIGKINSNFAETMRIDLTKEFPIMDIKWIKFSNVVHELLWMLRGETNIKYLIENDCHIWTDDYVRWNKENFCEYKKLSLPFEQTKKEIVEDILKNRVVEGHKYGDMCKIYGHQWRRFNGQTDQIQNVLNKLKTNPDDRRMIIIGHNPTDLENNEVGLPSCFTEEMVVRNNDGEYIKISDISKNDFVLDKNNNYELVTDKSKTKYDGDILEIRTFFNNEPINTTPNHPFLVKNRGWVNAEYLTKDDYLGIPINKKNTIKSFIFNLNIGNGRNKDYKITPNKEDFYTFGFFLGDGWASVTDERVFFSINKKELDNILPKIRKTIKISKEKEYKSVYKFGSRNKKWINIFREFGHGAKNKKIPNWVLDSPKEFLEEFLEGYLDADGHKYIENKEESITTISKNVAYGIQLLCAKLEYISSIYFQKRKETTIIEGRTVNQNNLYQLRIRRSRLRNSSNFEFSNDFLWIKIKNINKSLYNGYVYNMSVNESHTYNIKNFIVHNCHNYMQFYTIVGDDGRRKLSTYCNIRSNDMGLGNPYNTIQYALITHIFAKLVDMDMDELVINMVDCHLYHVHFDAANEWLKRYDKININKTIKIDVCNSDMNIENLIDIYYKSGISFNNMKQNNINNTYCNANIKITGEQKTIDDFKFEDFVLTDYNPQPYIKAQLLT